MDKLDSTIIRSGSAYVAAAVALGAVARLGVFPGTGEAFAGQPFLSHPYRVSMALVVVGLALALGTLSAWAGRRLGARLTGLWILVFGGMATGAALSIAPWIYYPNDQYPVTFMWLMLGAPTGFTSWLVGSLVFGAPEPEDAAA